jgi:hypothetical protein
MAVGERVDASETGMPAAQLEDDEEESIRPDQSDRKKRSLSPAQVSSI